MTARQRVLGDRISVDRVERRLAAEAAARILTVKAGPYAERPVSAAEVIALARWIVADRPAAPEVRIAADAAAVDRAVNRVMAGMRAKGVTL